MNTYVLILRREILGAAATIGALSGETRPLHPGFTRRVLELDRDFIRVRTYLMLAIPFLIIIIIIYKVPLREEVRGVA